MSPVESGEAVGETTGAQHSPSEVTRDLAQSTDSTTTTGTADAPGETEVAGVGEVGEVVRRAA